MTTSTPFHYRRPPNVPKAAGPYSQAIKAASQIFVAGQIPAGPDGVVKTGSITELTRQCCLNLEAILKEAGSGIEKVVKVGVFLDDMAHFQEMNAEYEKWFVHKPARTCVAVRTLPKGVPVSGFLLFLSMQGVTMSMCDVR